MSAEVDLLRATICDDVAPNSLTPGATIEANAIGVRIIDNKVFQSGVFNVALNNRFRMEYR